MAELDEEERRGSMVADDEDLARPPAGGTPESPTQAHEFEADSGSDDGHPWSEGD